MATRLLAFPLRLGTDGTLATVAVDSDDHHAQQIALLIGTVRGERPIPATFGLTDPAFVGVDPNEVAAQVAVFGPPVELAGVTTTYRDDGITADVEVTFA